MECAVQDDKVRKIAGGCKEHALSRPIGDYIVCDYHVFGRVCRQVRSVKIAMGVEERDDL